MQFANGILKWQGVTIKSNGTTQDSVPLQILHPGQTQSIEAKVGLEVRSISGTIWITQEGEATDIMLRAGQSWTAVKKGRVVLQAIGSSQNSSLAISPEG